MQTSFSRNIFNIMAVLGLSSVVASGGINISDVALRFDIPVMRAVSVACLPIFFTGDIVSRWEGCVFLGYYPTYTIYLILSAKANDMLPIFSRAMPWFVIPITALTLIVVFVRAIRIRKSVT